MCVKSTDQCFLCDDTVTFDISTGPALGPADVMSTIATPADDMSITVAPVGVVLVYKPRSTRRLLMKSAPQFAVSIHPKRNNVIMSDSKCS